MQRLVRTLTVDWKLTMAPPVREYVLAAPNLHVKGTVWSIEKLHAAPMPSMVVTGVPLEVSDVEVKEELIVGSKGVLFMEHGGNLERL